MLAAAEGLQGGHSYRTTPCVNVNSITRLESLFGSLDDVKISLTVSGTECHSSTHRVEIGDGCGGIQCLLSVVWRRCNLLLSFRNVYTSVTTPLLGLPAGDKRLV